MMTSLASVLCWGKDILGSRRLHWSSFTVIRQNIVTLVISTINTLSFLQKHLWCSSLVWQRPTLHWTEQNFREANNTTALPCPIHFQDSNTTPPGCYGSSRLASTTSCSQLHLENWSRPLKMATYPMWRFYWAACLVIGVVIQVSVYCTLVETLACFCYSTSKRQSCQYRLLYNCLFIYWRRCENDLYNALYTSFFSMTGFKT